MANETLTLAAFLLSRVAEDEADPWRGAELGGSDNVVGRAEHEAYAAEEREWVSRVLAECEAKRQIVALHSEADGRCETCYIYATRVSENPDACPTLRALAAVYAGHPDYREEWRP